MWMTSTQVEEKIDILQPKKVLKLRDKYSDWSGNVIDQEWNIDFSWRDDWKILWYFYDECTEFLKELAKYVEWYVEFEPEEWDNQRIVFEWWKCYVISPEVKRPKCTKDDLL